MTRLPRRSRFSRSVRAAGTFLIMAAAACSESNGPEKIGPPTSLIVASGAQNELRAPAGTAISTPVTLRVVDANGRGVKGQTVNFAVTAGGGSLAAATATTDANGNVTLPTWTLGKSAVAQTVHATSGSFSADVNASVRSDYGIEVRFFGDAMSAEHQALFTNAAARLRGIVTGDLINVQISEPIDLATSCGMTGLPSIAEPIDDVIIYAAVQTIDGAGKVLAQAGPCLVRTAQYNRLTVVGVMSFDIADLEGLANGGRLQDVITHEMLHVLGIGTLWQTRNLLSGKGTDTVNYVGSLARVGCVDSGGGAACAASVPVENTGGSGTRDGHWRESTFDAELMTGYAEKGDMPLSVMTVAALEDLGYAINREAKDVYSVPTQSAIAARVAAEPKEEWERELPNLWSISTAGRLELLRSGTQKLP